MRRTLLPLSLGLLASCGRLQFEVLEDANESCAAPYVELEDGCYRFVTTRIAWADAEADCEDDVPGATHLAVTDAAEVALIELTIAAENPWIGLANRGSGWQWVTGELLDFDLWQDGDPEGEGDCARIINGEWDDSACSEVNAYVCELDGRPPSP